MSVCLECRHGQSKEQQRQAFQQKGSILDTVREEAASLNRRLGKRDQQKMDEYLSSVREVEQGLARSENGWMSPSLKSAVPAADFEISPESTIEFIRSKVRPDGACVPDEQHARRDLSDVRRVGAGLRKTVSPGGRPEDHLTQHLSRCEPTTSSGAPTADSSSTNMPGSSTA